MRLTDADRRCLAAAGAPLGRRLLTKVATMVTSDTIRRWHRLWSAIMPAAQFLPNFHAASRVGADGWSRFVRWSLLDERIAYDPETMAQSRRRVALRTLLRVGGDLLRLVLAAGRSHAELAAENLFLRKQLGLYVERQVKPRRADDATRIALVALSWLIDWRRILTV
jgi:hypothetical protein